MARPVFWPTNDSYVLSIGGMPNAGIPVRIYTRQTGGTQITDLQYVNGAGTATGAVPSGVLTSDGNGLIPAFAGPDGGATTVWGDHGMSAERIALTSDPTGGGGGGSVTFGTTAGTAAEGNDARITGALSAATAAATFAQKSALYATATDYIVGQLVVSSGVLYRVSTAHTSSGAINLSNFTAVLSGAVVTLDADGTLVVDGVTVEVGTDGEIATAIAASASATLTTAGTNAATAIGVETAARIAADALKADLASPTFTGVPAMPTAAALTSTTQGATTAFTTAAVAVETSRATTAEALKAPLASPTFTGTPAAPTATVGTSTTQLATTAFVSSSTAYDRRANIYNQKGAALLRTRAKIAGIRNATANTYLDIGIISTSLSSGSGPSPGVRAESWPTYWAQALAAQSGITVATSTGWVPAVSVSSGTEDLRWALTGFVTFDTLTPLLYGATVGNTAVFTSDVAGTVASFKYLNGGTGTSFTYAIDGGSTTTVSPTAGNTWTTINVTGLANTTHTITIVVTVLGGGLAVFIGGAKVDSGAAGYGIRISNYGVGGATYASVGTFSGTTPSGFGALPQMKDIAPTLVVIELGTNNSTNTVAQHVTSISNLVTGFQAIGVSDVVLCSGAPISGQTDAVTDAQNKLEQANLSVSDTLGVPVLNMYDFFGRLFAPANTAGLYQDTVHPNKLGTKAFAYGPPLSLLRG